MGAIRVLIVDDHAPVRLAMTSLFATTKDITVVGTCVDGNEAVMTATHVDADVVLMDLRMPGLDGISAAAQILDRDPELRVIVLSAYADVSSIRRARSVGAAGYQLKTADPEALIEVVRAVAAGRTAFGGPSQRTAPATTPGLGGPASPTEGYRAQPARSRLQTYDRATGDDR